MSTQMDNAANEVIRAAEECRFRETDHACPRCGKDLEVYYCENRTFAVRCTYCETITLVVANNPDHAASKVGHNAKWVADAPKRRLQREITNMERRLRAMKHCIGMDYTTPYRRHAQLYYRPYRNRYATGNDCDGVDIWLELETLGMAKRNRPDGWTFHLTREGLDWLGEQINVIIHDEE